jgi:hypothetical protein
MTSPFREIVSGLGLSESSKVAILRVYGDAGGNRDKSSLALGAYVGTVQEWDSGFYPRWSDELKAEGIECFHRNKMEPPFYGEFAEKGWNKEHQIAVLGRLHKIIRENTSGGCGQAVVNDPFNRLMPKVIQEKYGGAYGWCVLRTIVWFGLFARQYDDWIHYFFEAGDLGQGRINQAIKELYNSPKYREMFRIASWTFASKKGPQGVIQLQAGDFMGFEAYKAADNYVAGSPRKQRASFDDLLRPFPQDLVMLWADDAISHWLANLDQCDGDVIESLICRHFDLAPPQDQK